MRTGLTVGGQTGDLQWLTLGEDELKSRHASRQADRLAHWPDDKLEDESLEQLKDMSIHWLMV